MASKIKSYITSGMIANQFGRILENDLAVRTVTAKAGTFGEQRTVTIHVKTQDALLSFSEFTDLYLTAAAGVLARQFNETTPTGFTVVMGRGALQSAEDVRVTSPKICFVVSVGLHYDEMDFAFAINYELRPHGEIGDDGSTKCGRPIVLRAKPTHPLQA